MFQFLFWFGVIVNIGSFLEMMIKIYKNNGVKNAIQSPYGKFFLYTFLITCLVYLFLINWGKIHYGDLPTVQKIIIVHDTPNISTKIPAVKPNLQQEYKNITPKIFQTKPKIIYVPVREKIKQKLKADTTVKEVYNLTAPVSQSAIGHGASVTNNNFGIKQRHLNDALLTRILVNIKDKNSKIDVTTTEDKECEDFANEIVQKLYTLGYTNIEHSISGGRIGGYRYNQVEIIKIFSPDYDYRIYVNPSSNIQ